MPLAEGLTTRKMRPRQRTDMLSPRVISEGMRSVISTSAPSASGASVKKNTPRELRSWVNPTPSKEAAGCRRESGRRKGNRCPTRRSTRTGGLLIVASLLLPNRRKRSRYFSSRRAIREARISSISFAPPKSFISLELAGAEVATKSNQAAGKARPCLEFRASQR